MTIQVLLNDFIIEAIDVTSETEDRRKISFTFKVTHEESHSVTTLLYKNDFFVQVPSKNISFHATITKYFTSITNLYIEGAVGEFFVELTEKNTQSE